MLERIVARLRDVEPRLEAVVLCGSFARGEGDRFSDVDILALTAGDPVRSERIWFETGPEGKAIHVSVGLEPVSAFDDDDDDEPASWALGLAAQDVMRLIWATPRARRRLGEALSEHLPPGPAEIEDFAELYMKVRRGQTLGDRVMLRWAARMLAEFSVAILAPYNPTPDVRSPVEALKAALGFQVAPDHYRTDFEICAGLSEASDAAVFQAASRLQDNLLSWLASRLAGETFEADDVRTHLQTGALQTYLNS